MAEDHRLRDLMVEYQSGRFEAFDEFTRRSRRCCAATCSGRPATPRRPTTWSRRRFCRFIGPGTPSIRRSRSCRGRMAIARHVWLMHRRTASRRPWETDDVTEMELPVRAEAGVVRRAHRREARPRQGGWASARRRDPAPLARFQLQGNCRACRHCRDRGEAAFEPRYGAAAIDPEGAGTPMTDLSPDLRARLAADYRPVKPLRPPVARTLWLLPLAALAWSQRR